MSNLVEIQRFQQDRRNQYDVTNRIQIDSYEASCLAVCKIFTSTYHHEAPQILSRAFKDFSDLYTGNYPGYHSCDTLYHDLQHSLDMTLAMARLMSGYEQQNPRHKLGKQRFVLGIIGALFHDAGYIRRKGRDTAINGAMYTYTHVQRSAEFLKQYLKQHNMGDAIGLITQLVHFTGYEMSLDSLSISDEKDNLLGQLLGTADLISQMSDRCYLEKCRDRLYPEFVLANLAPQPSGRSRFQPESAEQLLRETLEFYRGTVLIRLEHDFNGCHRYACAHFKGRNYYMESLDNNLLYLESLIRQDDFSSINRRPPTTAGSQYFPFHLIELKSHSHPLIWSGRLSD